MNNNVRVKAQHKSHPNLRKLARALIALARQQLEAEQEAKEAAEQRRDARREGKP